MPLHVEPSVIIATDVLPVPPVPKSPVPAPPPPPAPGIGTLLANARDAGASDLHIIAGRAPLYRLAGDLRPNGQIIEPGRVDRMVMPLVPPHLHAVLAETGSCDFALAHAEGRFRVNVCRQLTGLKACLRLVADDVPTVEGLKLHVGIAAAAQHRQGLILFTGPTGHGKTTTLTAVVDRINRTTMHHVITIEDPIEHLHPRARALMSQREVGTHTKGFASALQAALREDADVIVVGELRDLETVRMALEASETGHLVLATMNAPSATRTIERIIEMFPPGDQLQVRLTLAAGLRLIVSQRLVRARQNDRMYAAFELLPGSVPLAALIRENKTLQIPSLQQRGKALGIIRLDDALAELVAQERVTLADASAAADAPLELEAAVKALRVS
jgi:twitching motility protein PilT